jgi:hypothetical protein
MISTEDHNGYAIAIPACNEEARIRACLDACRLAMARVTLPGIIVVLVNNSNDATEQCVANWMRDTGWPVICQNITFPKALAHAGSARRAALELARKFTGDSGFLLTTDADSRPCPHWVEANLLPLKDGTASLVCGAIELEPSEYNLLPQEVVGDGAVEGQFRRLALEIDNILDPDPVNIWPFHGAASGASLAVSAAAYDLVGGMPAIPCGEDRMLARRFFEHDLPIFYSDQARVVTSCRLDGRAQGGMADTIAERVAGGEYVCDESVETAQMIWFRAECRSRLRTIFHSKGRAGDLQLELKRIGLSCQDLPHFSKFGALWTYLEEACPELHRHRMTWPQMALELPLLELMRDKALFVTQPVIYSAVSGAVA